MGDPQQGNPKDIVGIEGQREADSYHLTVHSVGYLLWASAAPINGESQDSACLRYVSGSNSCYTRGLCYRGYDMRSSLKRW